MAINLDILRNYLNHDEHMVQRFLHLFCTAVPQDLEKLRKYISGDDLGMASITAHGIKTQCAYLGLEEARNLALNIEDLQPPASNAHDLLEKLDSILQSEIAEMRMTMNI